MVEERSFSRAAEKMYLTQPSLTKHIKNLETLVDAKVVNRNNTGISLTLEGKIVYDYARRIFKMMDEAREKLSRVSADDSGSISISASTIPSTYILPRVLTAFHKGHPLIRCYVQMNDSDATLDMILDNRAEIGFIGKAVLHRKLEVKKIWRDRLILIVPEGHRWCTDDHVTIDDLSGEPFIIRERGSATRSVLEDNLQKKMGRSLSGFNIVSELGSSEAVKEAVIAGLGVSIISARAVQREIQSGLIIEKPVEDLTIERNFYLIQKKGLDLMSYHTLFLNFLAESESDYFL